MATAEEQEAKNICMLATQAELTLAIPTSTVIPAEGVSITGVLLRDATSNVFSIRLDPAIIEKITTGIKTGNFKGGSRKIRQPKKGGRKRKSTGGKSRRYKKRS